MIRYALKCGGGHGFDAWFRSSSSFDEQVASKEVVCPVCGSSKIEKAPMAPRISRKDGAGEPDSALRDRVRQARNELLKNADDVGDNFAREARKIHYKETSERRIYGRATDEEAKALREEGVEFTPLPVLPEDLN